MDDESVERILERERLQMEQIRQLDMEELQIEEVDDDHSSDDDDVLVSSGSSLTQQLNRPNRPVTDLAMLLGQNMLCISEPSKLLLVKTSLCEQDMFEFIGTQVMEGFALLQLGQLQRLSKIDKKVDREEKQRELLFGAAWNKKKRNGVVLFPEATLPLRVIQPRFIAAVEKALNQVDAPCTIGVVRVHRHPGDGRLRFASVGTTAEIRQYRRLDDGSLNVVTRGQQRFRLRRRWMDVEGAPCGEVQIVQEDTPLRTPKDAFAQLASVGNFRKCSFSRAASLGDSPDKRRACEDIDNDWERMSATSTVSDHSATDSSDSPHGYGVDKSLSGDEDFMDGWDQRRRKFCSDGFSRSDQVHKCAKFDEDENLGWDSVEEYASGKRSGDREKRERHGAVHEKKWMFCAPLSFWPHWVYQMYDSYSLARRAADLWKQIIGSPNMDDYIRKPDLLSFHIASKLPMSESTRQELLEIDGISYRLRREIQLLKGFNLIRCKNCLTLIAKRSDMVVMSSDGPLNAYVNPDGFVHEIITVYNANGLALLGSPVKEYSWFPGNPMSGDNIKQSSKQ
ncbi:Protein cereblon [Cocos nucifera]|nr:Protein cereblon [Cocos nucifera]